MNREMTAISTALAGPDKQIAVPPAPPKPADLGELRRIPLTQLVESMWNPRQRFDATKLAELAESLRTQGQLAPIVVRQMPNRRGELHETMYELGAGHRRYRAALQAQLPSLLAVVRDMHDTTFLELLVFENGNRNDLHALEEAAGYKRLMEQAGYTVPRIGERDGRSIEYVYSRLKLLQLIPLAKKLFLADAFTAGHAILIARLKPADQARLIGTEKEYWDDGALFIQENALEDPDALAAERDSEESFKPISIRELERWIAMYVRFRPEETDPVLFPETAETLAHAAETQMKVVQITHEFCIQDEARDAKVKTIMPRSWKRADGQQGSKKCEHRVLGVIATGPGYGDAFNVCIAKEKCPIHWPEQFKKALARKKAGAKQPKAAPARPGQSDTARMAATAAREKAEALLEERLDAQRERLIKERAPQWALEIRALANQIRLPSQMAAYLARANVVAARLEDMTEGYDDDATTRGAEIFAALKSRLPGKWATGYGGAPEMRDGQAAIVGLALLFWYATCTGKLDAELDAAASKAIAAEAAAAAKAKATSTKKQPAKKAGRKGNRK